MGNRDKQRKRNNTYKSKKRKEHKRFWNAVAKAELDLNQQWGTAVYLFPRDKDKLENICVDYWTEGNNTNKREKCKCAICDNIDDDSFDIEYTKNFASNIDFVWV